ncbi:hypothetical protein [Pseudoduganella namucuonensis]|uniref:Uncharacterized protein n=1 Tax=Pseudoduganella namucuonensis TaxID=1035707 RepID=A0A1I7HF75_9BURK|nr:hypothetical protein [Pseudoduganella namucuonensis]SFU59385.1 hypothetical protein SAMN05216552_1005229 [Pseudoduganella namucuonensis]
MNAPLPRALEPADTVEVARLRHRLALGLAWLDALTRAPANGPWWAVLEKLGPYEIDRQFEPHGAARHALRHEGLLRKRFELALAGGDARWSLRVFSAPPAAPPRKPVYATALDPRLYVPRRLRLTPAVDGDAPAATPQNIRRPWLWPGSAYPLPGNATAVRGRVLRGPDLASAKPIPWVRLVATVPAGVAVFADATPIGYAHGDDRGEFVLVLDNKAVSGATLSNPVEVRLWPHLPPAATQVDPADPLASLPLEEGGTDGINDVLRGHAVPAGYTAGASKVLALRLGETASGAGTTLLFA